MCQLVLSTLRVNRQNCKNLADVLQCHWMRLSLPLWQCCACQTKLFAVATCSLSRTCYCLPKCASWALALDCVTPAYLQLVSPPLCCSCCFSEAPNLSRAFRSILLGFGKKRSACSQSTVSADFVSSLLKNNFQPQIVIG